MKESTLKVDSPHLAFFTSDPHFYHEGIIGHCQRPFRNVHEMSEALIANWNAIVPESGSVFVLGDMFWKEDGKEKYINVMRRLNGRKWLVCGNHDYFTREECIDMGFVDVFDMLKIHIDKRKVVCCHYPLLEWEGFYHGSWHLHGHAHGRSSHFSFRVMDVGMDTNQFMPYTWKQIVKNLDGGMELDQEGMKRRGDTARHAPFRF